MRSRQKAKFGRLCPAIFAVAPATRRFSSLLWKPAANRGWANEVVRSTIPDGNAQESCGRARTHGTRTRRVEAVCRGNRFDGAPGSGEIAAPPILEYLEA